MKKYIIYIFSCLLFMACTTSVPKGAKVSDQKAEIYPDYHDITIPSNIAPLNFKITQSGDKYVTNIHLKNDEGLVITGQELDINLKKWHKLISQAKDDTLYVDIYVQKSGEWVKYSPIKWHIGDEIDPYITYRLIEPSYVNFETMRICQRNLENFEEDEIFNNCTFSDNVDGQCINCHVPQDYNRSGHWQMHVRINKGGTLIADGENVKKINLKRPGTISAGVYPAWHPTKPLIVYSNNNTQQVFHSYANNKVEVQDSASDLILYDVENDNVSIIANDSTEWETFPSWSPDGKYIYYVSATVPALNHIDLSWYRHDNYKDIKYNIYRKAFDEGSLKFGPTDTVYMASEQNASATLPRISPDGRYLLFTQGEYGTFHIWHHDADLYLMDLTNGEIRPLDEVNSDDTESYHNWSSNGRWIIFSSRREDGDYTRLYLAYFDKEGKAHKPFLIPQKSAMSNKWLFKSYNIPEFMCEPNITPRKAIIDALNAE